MTVMVAVGLWAALKGGKALWVWPASFGGVMIVGGVLGMLGVPVPFVEPGILASVVALGLLVALAVDLPVAAGAAIIALFAVFHGHAHGTEVPETGGGILYLAGFAIATAALHGVGIAAAIFLGVRYRNLVRAAGAACVAVGVALIAGVL
jgi:urease accessory protein